MAEILDVRECLAGMVAKDQSLRRARRLFDVLPGSALDDALQQRLADSDRRNAEGLATIVKRWGWVRISVFGADASNHAWTIAQHADHDPEMQEFFLKNMERALSEGDVSGADYAFLFDRLRIGRGERQGYGTQGSCVGPGNWVPAAIDAPERVDERRSAAGLPPISEYAASMNDVCR